MSVTIHPSAIIHSKAEIGEDVIIGPYSIIQSNSKIGDRTKIESHVLVDKNTILGNNSHLFHGSVVGTVAQDLKYRGEESWLKIGDNALIREYCTVNRGTQANNGWTIIGDNCSLLAYSHIGHDCIVGNNLIASNNLGLSGHCVIGNNVTFGGKIGVAQFCNIGDYSFIGKAVNITKDIIPFALIGDNANSVKVIGINEIGLERKGFDEQRRRKIKNFYKFLFRGKSTFQISIKKITEDFKDDEDWNTILKFLNKSSKGVYRMD